MFPEDSRTNSDMKWFESNIGPIATVEGSFSTLKMPIQLLFLIIEDRLIS